MSEDNINYEVNDFEERVENGFLGDLNSDTYIPPPTEKQLAQKQKQDEREYKKMISQQAKEGKKRT